MLTLIKRKLPDPIKKALIKVKQRTYDNWRKKLLFKRIRSKHAAQIVNLQGKNKVRVGFLVLHKSVWKVDSVFKKMLSDPFFEPFILICPYTAAVNEDAMKSEMKDAYDYFNRKGYPVVSAYSEKEKRWRALDELKPEIVFLTNPYRLTKSQYYEDAYNNYLCCYVPYYFMATTHTGDLDRQLNTVMLNSMWRIYWPHQYILEQYQARSVTKGTNSRLTGYPATEVLLDSAPFKSTAWRAQANKKKKIIYAPHHSIESEESSLSTFLQYGEYIRGLSMEYRGAVYWSFKPHPMLKKSSTIIWIGG